MGCPIRKSTDITSAFDSPWLIVDCYVLHRLLVPRHPLCALSSLTMQSDLFNSTNPNYAVSLCFWILLSCICPTIRNYSCHFWLPIMFHFTFLFLFLYSVFKVQSFRLIKIRISIVISNYSNLDSNYHIRFNENMVGSSGLEPPTSRLSGVRSNHLSYEPIMVEMNRIELSTPCLQSRCSPSWATPPRLVWVLTLWSPVSRPSKLTNDVRNPSADRINLPLQIAP